MGSWNQTCELSNLPILLGDEVTIAILVETGEEKSIFSCYYNDKYAPLCLPIIGEYNEYGGIKNARVSACTMRLLSSLEIVFEDGKAYHINTIEKLVDDITSSKLYLKCNFPIKNKYKIECAFYHKKLYDILVEEIAKQTPYNRDSSFFELYTKKFQEIATNYSKNEYDDKYSLNKAYNNVFKDSTYGIYSLITETIETFSNVNEMKEFHEELVNYIMFTYALIIGRYGFGVTTGAGSQDNCVMIQRIIAKFILKYTENNERYNVKNNIYYFN